MDIREAITHIIAEYSSRHNWQLGLRQKAVWSKLAGLRFEGTEIQPALTEMESEGILYKRWVHGYPYWFVHRRHCPSQITPYHVLRIQNKTIYVNCKNCGEEFSETEITDPDTDIHEHPLYGHDVLEFKCPHCGQPTNSARYG